MYVHVDKNVDDGELTGTLSFAEKHAILLKCKYTGVQGGRKRIEETKS